MSSALWEVSGRRQPHVCISRYCAKASGMCEVCYRVCARLGCGTLQVVKFRIIHILCVLFGRTSCILSISSTSEPWTCTSSVHLLRSPLRALVENVKHQQELPQLQSFIFQLIHQLNLYALNLHISEIGKEF